ncbi:PREDICTED: 2'-deoxynucleoside 5'-phosphate N-hydrolase 1 [Myotis brandtii]|uniref:2'-deoxynucleoside 5'-phosphate N-hydrolase 1 n=1 Tax=Myotis brandtii TaxID=109478 RepID=UPI0003BB8CCF|nr:PREDICTED: 2'-deoxynucleoside 5'-phosphate N-hydrolase 1 [Myotis brandtii]
MCYSGADPGLVGLNAVLGDLFKKTKLPGLLERAWEQPAEGDRFIHQRDLALLQRADLIVAEVTQPSLGVGYEVGRAVALNKRILCLFRRKSGRVLSAMIRGAADGYRFQVWDYEVGDVEVMLDRYFAANPPEQVASSLDPTT